MAHSSHRLDQAQVGWVDPKHVVVATIGDAMLAETFANCSFRFLGVELTASAGGDIVIGLLVSFFTNLITTAGDRSKLARAAVGFGNLARRIGTA